jgi:hypothetical protein
MRAVPASLRNCGALAYGGFQMLAAFDSLHDAARDSQLVVGGCHVP